VRLATAGACVSQLLARASRNLATAGACEMSTSPGLRCPYAGQPRMRPDLGCPQAHMDWLMHWCALTPLGGMTRAWMRQGGSHCSRSQRGLNSKSHVFRSKKKFGLGSLQKCLISKVRGFMSEVRVFMSEVDLLTACHVL